MEARTAAARRRGLAPPVAAAAEMVEAAVVRFMRVMRKCAPTHAR
eukprot:CAMPEP_0173244958 /NCGR_PEP_ID=MMETSP1142-20121109/16448_1 /TAXON_ID=483371 /ORGANISM="non described non described, Strain CCMP2298" /LENGTH=44 /DNA_ID= /DNA_START= /DNA_END= /DNA_ORIENTATION=